MQLLQKHDAERDKSVELMLSWSKLPKQSKETPRWSEMEVEASKVESKQTFVNLDQEGTQAAKAVPEASQNVRVSDVEQNLGPQQPAVPVFTDTACVPV